MTLRLKPTVEPLQPRSTQLAMMPLGDGEDCGGGAHHVEEGGPLFKSKSPVGCVHPSLE